jgi:hypothetical protein
VASTNKRTRDFQRLAHRAGSGVLGTYLYSPWRDDALFTAVVQWGVFPGLVLSGGLLWFWTRLRRSLRRGVGTAG